MENYSEHKKHRMHRNVLYTLVVVIVIINIISMTVVWFHIARVEQNLADVKKNLTKEFTSALESYNAQNQENFNDITRTLLSQQSSVKSFQNQIDQLKLSSGDFSEVIDNAVNSVVTVTTNNALGSGFIVTDDGYIVTNEHVIADANAIKIMTSDKVTREAELVGADKFRDIALLKISGSFDFLQLADSDNLQTGSKVIAIGNPLGLSLTVTEGIISGLHREGPNGLDEYVQTDVSLNLGNSGGPLIRSDGKVVGMNNFKIGGAENIGFALESNSIAKVVKDITNSEILL